MSIYRHGPGKQADVRELPPKSQTPDSGGASDLPDLSHIHHAKGRAAQRKPYLAISYGEGNAAAESTRLPDPCTWKEYKAMIDKLVTERTMLDYIHVHAGKLIAVTYRNTEIGAIASRRDKAT